MTEMDLLSLQVQSCSLLSPGITESHFTFFCSCNLILDPMTFTRKLYVTILKIYGDTKISKFIPYYRHADEPVNIYDAASPVVNKW